LGYIVQVQKVWARGDEAMTSFSRGLSKPMLNVLLNMSQNRERRWKTSELLRNQYSIGFAHSALSDCVRFGLVEKVAQGTWIITDKGFELIQLLSKQ
jgi:hypothetical protein